VGKGHDAGSFPVLVASWSLGAKRTRGSWASPRRTAWCWKAAGVNTSGGSPGGHFGCARGHRRRV